ncbi:signal peptide protein, YSIRK family [Dictyocaulus viviparus]|uniref:Glycogen [starch] synthase n=1 Tax=Dictyocaulus viviparus TaxID=29172 RepID=A0A0D8XIQ6_DICVI|nr:signal peptide protein, YSIRK family [Dictyocaulus viviparus]
MDVGFNIIVLIVLYSTLAVTGLLGNIWVLVTVSSQLLGCCSSTAHRGRIVKPNTQSSAYIYLLLLSVVDLVSLVPVPMLVTDLQKNEFIFGIALCKVLWFSEGTNKTLSPMILTALSIDRYIAVCKPALIWMRQTKFAVFVVSVCIVASLLFIAPITAHAKIADMEDFNGMVYRKCTLDENLWFDLVHTLTCYVAPLVLIFSVYIVILVKLFRHTRYSTVGRKTSISLSRVVKCSVMVVAFYFICWTPYWTMRIQALVNEAEKNVGVASSNKTSLGEFIEEEVDETTTPVNGIFIMYLMHSLPYAQSAFNWLFYAFLNRNLRSSSGRYNNGGRSLPMTSTIIENGPSSGSGLTPIWKNLQQMGSQLKTASIDTGNALLRMSPFRSRIQSRSSTCLDVNHLDQLMPPSSLMSFSLMNLQRRTSTTLTPRTEPSLVGKALSSSDLPVSHIINNPCEPALSVNYLLSNHTEIGINKVPMACVSFLFVQYRITFIVAVVYGQWLIKTTTDSRCKDVTVVAFIIYPAAANSFNVDSLRGQAVCKQLKDTIAKIKDNVASRMFEESVRGRIPDPEDLLLPAEKVQLKRCILAAKRDAFPPICTHNMVDNANDPVLQALRRVQLFNHYNDRVKVVFHPEFLSSVSPLIGLDYEDFVRGCHLGVFPSYYEPWGYTPAECTVMGVPSVTTNLSGFGCFINEHVTDAKSYGIHVIDRRFKGVDESINELVDDLYEFTCLSRRQRIIVRNRTERLSELLDWKTLSMFYRDARRMALKKTHPDLEMRLSDAMTMVPRPTSAPGTPLVSRPTTPHESDIEEDSELDEYEAQQWNHE